MRPERTLRIVKGALSKAEAQGYSLSGQDDLDDGLIGTFPSHNS